MAELRPVRVDVPAHALQLAVGAVARHRARAVKDMPPVAVEGLLVAVKPSTGEPGSMVDRIVVAATNRYTAALASTDVADADGEKYVGPSDPADAWTDLNIEPGLFESVLTGGAFEADKDPVRDIRRLAEDDPDADITVTVQSQSLRLDGPAGHLLWRRIGQGAVLFDDDAVMPGATIPLSSHAPDVPLYMADLIDDLPADVTTADRAWTWPLLKLHESLCGPTGALRLVHPRGRAAALVTAPEAPTPRIGLIHPRKTDTG